MSQAKSGGRRGLAGWQILRRGRRRSGEDREGFGNGTGSIKVKSWLWGQHMSSTQSTLAASTCLQQLCDLLLLLSLCSEHQNSFNEFLPI